jgi:hypothetical protein
MSATHVGFHNLLCYIGTFAAVSSIEPKQQTRGLDLGFLPIPIIEKVEMELRSEAAV